MKIIGKTERGFIIEAEKSELEKLEDLYYGKGSYGIGTLIHVSTMYNQVEFLKKHTHEVEVAKLGLRRIADNLEVLTPFVAPEVEGD